MGKETKIKRDSTKNNMVLVSYEEIRKLRLLKKNLMSGVILRISPDLVRLLMEKDWRNG